MGADSVTDDKLQALLAAPKRVTNPSARQIDKGPHLQTNYTVRSDDGQEFTLYTRQNKTLEDDFSCGLAWNAPSGAVLTLVRYNGSSHIHPNSLGGERIVFACHIHHATQRYIDAGKKPDGHADASDRYTTMRGALHCLVTDCHVSGLKTEPDQPDFFHAA